MKKIEKIKKYLKDNPLADEKRISKKFNLSFSESLIYLAQIKNNTVTSPQISESSQSKIVFFITLLKEKVIRTHYVYVCIFLLAILVRISYAIKLNTFPQLNIQILDSEYYVNWAKQIAQGNILGDTIFFTEPFYAYFLAFIMKLSSHWLIITKIIQMSLGSLVAIIIAKIGEKIFNRDIGLIAGVIVAIYGPFIFYENLILKTSLEIFSLTGFVWFLLYMLEKKASKYYLFGGILLGVTSLIKGNNLVFLPIVLLILFFSHSISKKEKITLSLFFTFGLFLAIFPVTARNYFVGKDFVPTNYSIGIVTYQGNWWGSDGSTAMVPSFLRPHPKYEEIDTIGMAEAYNAKPLSPSQISSFWIKKALGESFSNPMHFVKNVVNKICMIFNWHELSDDYSYAFYGNFLKILTFLPGFILISVSSIAGALLVFFSDEFRWSFSRHSKRDMQTFKQKTRLLIIIIGGYILVLLISNINSRYRMPLIPLFSLFSAVTLWQFWIKFKERSWLTIPLVSFFLLIGLTFSLIPLPIYSAINEDANAYHQIGSYYLEKQDYEKAKAYFEKTIAIDKNYAWAHKNLFLINMQQGNLKDAEANIKDSILIRSDDLSNYENLTLLKKAQKESIESVMKEITDKLKGDQQATYDNFSYEASRYIAAKDNEKAKELLQQSIEKFDNPPNSLIALASLRRSDGSTGDAIKYLSLAIEKNPYLLPARYNLANIYIEQKNYILAIPQLKEIYDVTPELGQTWSNLAIAYINTKNSAQATPIITAYVKKYQNDPSKKELVDKFQKLLSQNTNPQIK
jgi:tetratricopeptide (TPR) repeat protein